MTDQTPSLWKDDDFVYVDPETRTVIGRVEWAREGIPILKKIVAAAPATEEKGQKKERRFHGRDTYPWGTYRSMKRIYRLEGKVRDADVNATLDAILPKALSQAFWD